MASVKLKTLYKKTSTGAIQFWDINYGHMGTYARIETSYGQVGTDNPQVTEDVIESGKNIGKKNETTPFEQAQAEAWAKWEKQKKKGYVESVEAAQAEETDVLIEGGINPMLAHKFADHAAKIEYPAYLQPKLDGIRCIAILKNGKCTLWTRTRKPITSMPHIIAAIEKGIPEGNDLILDGELYNHDYKANFEHIVSLVRQEEPDPRHRDVQYHVYDIVNDRPFDERANKLMYMKARWFDGELVKVETPMVKDETEAVLYFETWRKEGYEGAMIRNARSLYENKRSYGLQKIKEFDDAEFEIIGLEEGRGRLAGHVGAFVCRDAQGREFKAKMSGSTDKLAEYLRYPERSIGKLLTVKYQGLSGKNGVPRFPVGVTIRDYE